MSVMLYLCMLCVALLMCLFVLYVACLTVFVNCLVKQFAMSVGVVAIFFLSVIFKTQLVRLNMSLSRLIYSWYHLLYFG